MAIIQLGYTRKLKLAASHRFVSHRTKSELNWVHAHTYLKPQIYLPLKGKTEWGGPKWVVTLQYSHLICVWAYIHELCIWACEFCRDSIRLQCSWYLDCISTEFWICSGTRTESQRWLNYNCIWAWVSDANFAEFQSRLKFSCIWSDILACEFFHLRISSSCYPGSISAAFELTFQLHVCVFGIQTRGVKYRLNSRAKLHSSNAAEMRWIWACEFQPAIHRLNFKLDFSCEFQPVFLIELQCS